ncbi:MAG: hypothetical protein FJ197_01485 [Gammaproteobacteria bacterium]|nr:hypothetical protein [Gammaproteobacteria bacterium]
MRSCDPDTDLEALMRRWHAATEFASAALMDYVAERDALGEPTAGLARARARWRAAEREKRALMRAIERLVAAEAA